MNIREVQCLLMLYQNTIDEGVRRRAVALVPELTEIGGTLTFNGTTRRRRLTDVVTDAEDARPCQ